MILLTKGLEKNIKIKVRILKIRAAANIATTAYKGSYNKALAITICWWC